MSQPTLPRFIEEGPANPCTISGHKLDWTQCTVESTCMLIDRSTLGKKRPDPCTFRRHTGDVSGGTSLYQCSQIAENVYGVPMDLHAGGSVATPYYGGFQLYMGRGGVLQGNTSAIGKGNINHAVELNQGQGYTKIGTTDQISVPVRVLVYDPWSDGPEWWSWDKVKAFAAALHPWGENDSRILGPGKWYVMFGPDTEPHVHLYLGARRTTPFPDQQQVNSPVPGKKVNVRLGPSTDYAVAMTLASGSKWTSFQVFDKGTVLNGSGRWWGNHDGNRWIHDSGLIGRGGGE